MSLLADRFKEVIAMCIIVAIISMILIAIGGMP